MSVTTLQYIPVELLRPSPFNPRKDLGDTRELENSIQAAGVRDPLTVRLLGDNTYEIVKGHRRHRAATKVGLTHVPCIVKEMSDDEARREQLIEAIHGQRLHWLDEAEAMAYFGRDASAIADMFSKSTIYVQRALRLVDLSELAKKFVREGKLSRASAHLLTALDEKRQRDCLLEMEKREDFGPNIVRWKIREASNDLLAVKWKLTDADLVPEAGACSVCPKQTGAELALFEQVQEESACLDGDCFAKKVAAWVEIEKKKKPDAIVVDSRQSYGRKPQEGTVALDKLTRVDKDGPRCDSTRLAIDVSKNGLKSGDLVCDDPKCKVHRGRQTGQEAQEARKKEIEKNRKERERGAALFLKVMTTVDAADVFIARTVWQRLWHDSKKDFCRAFGIEPKPTTYGGKDYESPVLEIIDGKGDFVFNVDGVSLGSLSHRDLTFAFALVDLLGARPEEAIKEVAKQFGIDLKSLSAEKSPEKSPEKKREKKKRPTSKRKKMK